MANLGGTKSIEVDAPIEACWALGVDVESAPQWQAGMKTMKVLDRDAEGNVVRKSGVMGVVITGGEVRPDDAVRVELPAGEQLALQPV